MKVELKSIKHFESMSEETNCFTANIYIDGIKVGYAKNGGYGGCTDYHIQPPELADKFNAWAKTLPPHKFMAGDKELEVKSDGEMVIDNLVEEFLKLKDQKRIEKIAAKQKALNTLRGFPITVQLVAGGIYIWAGVKTQGEIEATVARVSKKHNLVNPVQTII